SCFFFQAEDGIRDFHVTGVQTCALPILGSYNEQTARTLIDDISGLRNLWYVKTVRKEQDWFVVLHGEYSDRAAARAAVSQLPEEIRKLQPWVRQFREVQADAGR